MAYFSSTRPADRLRFTYAKRRKVVIQHKLFFVSVYQTIHTLFIYRSPQRRYYKRLSFSPRKQSGAMCSWQKAHLTRNRPDVFETTAVNPFILLDNLFLYYFFHKLIK